MEKNTISRWLDTSRQLHSARIERQKAKLLWNIIINEFSFCLCYVWIKKLQKLSKNKY